MRTIIRGGAIITPHETLEGHALIIEAGHITAIVAGPGEARPGDTVIPAGGLSVAPGLIDIHVHGADGSDTMDATPEALHRMARYFAAHGVTAYLPTTMAASQADTTAAVENVRSCPQPADGAAHLGVHLEGPYLNVKHKGAQPPDHLRPPDPAEYGVWFASGVARLMTVAPELDGALELIEAGVRQGVEFALGHTGADIACVTAAADRGLRQATHAFNGMQGLHHRDPGTAGAVLLDDRIYAQVIADGVHVHPAMVKLLIRVKGIDRTILITDAMRATGLSDGTYMLGDSEVIVSSGIARLAAGSLAGSTLTLDAAVRNVMAFAGLTLAQALRMATAVPAEALGLAGRKGVLAPGADADVILLDGEAQVVMTMVGGNVVYRRN